MAAYSFQQGNGFYHVDRTLAANLSALPSNSIYQYTGQLVGIANSNPQYPLDVLGSIHSSGLIYCGGNTLQFSGSNPQPGYSTQITANNASSELSIAGYSASASPAQRKIVMYENVGIAGNLTMQNNLNGNYQAITVSGSNGNQLQVGAAYTNGAFSTYANPGDFIIRSQPGASGVAGSIILQQGQGAYNIMISPGPSGTQYVSVKTSQFTVSGGIGNTLVVLVGDVSIQGSGNCTITGNLVVNGTINGKTI